MAKQQAAIFAALIVAPLDRAAKLWRDINQL
jgi:hypothetical protein